MDRLTQALLATSRSADQNNNETNQAFRQKQADDAASYEKQPRFDLGKTIMGGVSGLIGSGGNPLGALIGAAGGVFNKKAVNKLGDSVQGPQDDYTSLIKLLGMGNGGLTSNQRQVPGMSVYGQR